MPTLPTQFLEAQRASSETVGGWAGRYHCLCRASSMNRAA